MIRDTKASLQDYGPLATGGAKSYPIETVVSSGLRPDIKDTVGAPASSHTLLPAWERSPELGVELDHFFEPLGDVILKAARAHGHKIKPHGFIHVRRDPVQLRRPILLQVKRQKLVSHS